VSIPGKSTLLCLLRQTYPQPVKSDLSSSQLADNKILKITVHRSTAQYFYTDPSQI